MPTVTVVIPTYNCGKYLPAAIESVLAQTYPAVECVVVDDGSTDDTAEIAARYPQVRYLYQRNSERSVARNNGLLHSEGKYVSFLDADDLLSPTKIAEQVAFLERNEHYDVVYCKVTFFRDASPQRTFTLNRITPTGDILEALLHGNFITVHAPLIRRSAVEAIGGFNEQLFHNEDWEFFLRLSLSGAAFGVIDGYLALCRIHGANTSRDNITMHEKKWQVAREFVAEHGEELRRKGIDSEGIVAFHHADFGKALIANGRAAEGRRHIFAACRTRFPRMLKYLAFALLSQVFGGRGCRRWAGDAYRDVVDE